MATRTVKLGPNTHLGGRGGGGSVVALTEAHAESLVSAGRAEYVDDAPVASSNAEPSEPSEVDVDALKAQLPENLQGMNHGELYSHATDELGLEFDKRPNWGELLTAVLGALEA